MITELIDVEPLIGQYNPGLILVGPLFRPSINSSDRCFYVAGSGGKVYETISLGVVEAKAKAHKQRADFIKKLKSRFAEVLTFGGQLEMAQAVHSRWPNGETAKFLAFAELGAKPKVEVTGQQEGIVDNGRYAGVVSGGDGKQLADKVAAGLAALAKNIDGISRKAPRLARDPAQVMPLSRPAPFRGDCATTEQQRHSRLSQDDIALAILKLKSPGEAGAVPRPPVEGSRSLASIMLWFGAAGCTGAVVVALVAWVIVRPDTRQVAGEAAPAAVPGPSISVSRTKAPSQTAPALPRTAPNRLPETNKLAPPAEPAPAPVAGPSISVSRTQAPSQTMAEVPPSVPNQHTEATKPAPQAEPPKPAAQVEPAPATAPPSPPSQPSQAASVPAGTAPVSGPQPLPAQGGSPTRHLEPEEIATLVSRGTDLMKSGDLAAARLLLRRAAEAGNASAALMLGTTFDPLVIQQLGAIGVVPDVTQARQWYEKAAALGSDAASQRLAKLPQAVQ